MGQTGLAIFILVAAIIFLVFITGLFIFIFQYRKRKIIFENEKKIVAFESILKGQEEERTRMAKDLHDGLGSMLGSVKLNLLAILGNVNLPEEEAELLCKTISNLDNAISEMRIIAHNMMPEALLRLGLSEAIQDYCDSINESNIVKMKFVHVGLQQPLLKSHELILYRIVQELINNAIKHSEAKNIFVQVSQQNNNLNLVVEDDGKGFESEVMENKKGQGLRNVQSRVDFLKGILELDSRPNIGTSISIEMPI